MRVLITGASGFIGSAVAQRLQQAGHEVWGLARSADTARQLQQRGLSVHHGSLQDPDSLSRAAAAVDGVIHTAFIHSFTHMSWAQRLQILFGGRPGGIGMRFANTIASADREAIRALGAALEPGQALVAAFGTLALQPGRLALESDAVWPQAVGAGRGMSENLLHDLTERGIRTAAVRLPPVVHGSGDRAGLLPQIISLARKKRQVAYIADGNNRWPTVHRLDAANLMCLALEKATPGSTYHGVAEAGLPFCELASRLAQRLNLPLVSLPAQTASGYFGWLSLFAGVDNPASSQLTQTQLNWSPSGPSLWADLQGPDYF